MVHTEARAHLLYELSVSGRLVPMDTNLGLLMSREMAEAKITECLTALSPEKVMSSIHPAKADIPIIASKAIIDHYNNLYRFKDLYRSKYFNQKYLYVIPRFSCAI